MKTNVDQNNLGHFVDNGDGTITDTRTGLIWMRCALGQTWDGITCTGEALRYKLDSIFKLNVLFANFRDWRLPIIEELKSIISPIRTCPAIDIHVFPRTPSDGFWSSNKDELSKTAWFVSFTNGSSGIGNKKNDLFVRLLREGDVYDAGKGDQTLGEVIITDIDVSKIIIRAAVELIRNHPNTFSEEIKEIISLVTHGQGAAVRLAIKDELRSSEDNQNFNMVVFLTWLIRQETVILANLRSYLHPFDLMPGAVIADINERALDLAGEPALVEVGDTVIVQREVLLQVIAS